MKFLFISIISIIFIIRLSIYCNFKCPDRLENSLIKDQLQPFLTYPSIKERVNNLLKLPIPLLKKLNICAIEITRNKWVYKYNPDNFGSFNSVFSYLNKMRNLKVCIKHIQPGTTILFLAADHFKPFFVIRYIRENNYIHENCSHSENPMQCTNDFVYQIIYEAPIFMFSKRTGRDLASRRYFLEFNKPLFPDPYVLDNNYRIKNRTRKKIYRWREKVDKIYWRGASTISSLFLNSKICMSAAYNGLFPRIGLILESYYKPWIIDAKFASITALNNDCINDLTDYLFNRSLLCLNDRTPKLNFRKICRNLMPKYRRIAKSLLITQYIDFIDHYKYKYLVSVDGWTAAWKRVSWILESNSLLIKQESDVVQWFYGELVHGEHFVEIPKDFEFDKFIKWARENDEEAERIAQNGKSFYLKYLSRDKLRKTTFTILQDYLLNYM